MKPTNSSFFSTIFGLISCEQTAMHSPYSQQHLMSPPRLSRHELDERTLIHTKGGTLQVELVSTAHTNGLLVYPLDPMFDALLSELEKQHPVLYRLTVATHGIHSGIMPPHDRI